MEDNTYNGWSNYATWRVMLEVFDGDAHYRAENEEEYEDIDELAEVLKNSVDDMIADNSGDELIAGWANAFIEDVDWYEIAEAEQEQEPKLIKKGKK